METSRPKPPTEADILARLSPEQRAKLDALSPADRAKALAAFANIQANLERLAPGSLAKLGPPFAPPSPPPGIVEIDAETVACSPDQGPAGPGTWADDRPPIHVRYGYGYEHAPGGQHRPQDPPNFSAVLDKLDADGPPVATAPVTSAPAQPAQDWKAAAYLHIATESLKNSAALDRVLLPLIARRPKSQRQIQRELEAVRDAWEISIGGRKACLEMLDRVVKAKTPADLHFETG
jgi:hypothetical protein